MKALSSKLPEGTLPIGEVKLLLFQDPRGNYFFEVETNRENYKGVFWTATYTTSEEALREAAERVSSEGSLVRSGG